ncbi:MAG: hypothetical protein MZU95_15070 [Desulfomicrobium escambiense]|nr:hypothetical protein [Desulfomicrobium escambiense]
MRPSQTSRSSTRPSRSSTLITGQKPVVKKARKSIAAFKLSEGMPVGVHGHAARQPDV